VSAKRASVRVERAVVILRDVPTAQTRTLPKPARWCIGLQSGQLALPMPGGHYNLALVMTGFTRGLYQLGRSVMYVNRGIGVAGPAVRFNCRPEMAMVELT